MKKRYIIICMLFIILIVSGYPYVKAEVLTLKYGTEFDLESFEMIEDISYCKVLEYDKQKAKVLYVCKGELSFLVTYQKNSDWKVETWESIWSKSGSADSFRWLLYH